ncbi:uncharacterized protein LOC110528191 isoform X2 [Oncorhynchus mykiss]|uniref:uncharacterized protein LOC110528191 isoform X2 n=1 Tax=Oncorhynchus mykiss TaxID=8022 RepID=UPI0018789C51|nr:uncharacterized protein LOC110528191 isoform X2 [Oncorhynchus mykiss]
MQNPDSGQGESTKNASGSVHSDNKAPNSGEMKPPGFDAVSVLWTFGKCLGALLPVYLAGYYRVSASFLVFGLMVYTGWRHSREAKEARLRSAIHHYDNEKQYTSMNIFRSKKDLPAWVNFPDVEKVEWLNKILQQVWPFVGQYLEKLLVETIAPSIRSSSTHLQTLTFTKVDFGDKAMKVVGVKAHTENERGQVLLDVYISYVGNVEINVEVKRYFCKAGVKGIQLHGMMRVILEPLIGDVPIVGAVTMFFIRRPKLDINWTGLTNLLDIPGLNIMSDTMIMDAIASFLVLPNRLTVPLVADLHVAQLRSPLPRGVVRIHLLEADDLPAKDNYMKGVIAGLSDPYALCRVGPQTFTSHVVDNTVCPKWGEMYEVIVHEVPGQELEVEVFDKDPDNDDFLGRTKIDLGIVKKSKVVDEWFTLKETKSGRVHFRLEWLVLLPNTERLEQVLQRNESMTVSSKTSDPPSAAILAVYLDKAEALPMKKGNKEPSPMVQLSVQDITRESRTCWTTINPKWEDAFTFFIPDPHKQSIDIQVKDNDRIQTLGSLSIPLSRLLSGPNLSLDQWFQLDKSGPASRIYINTVLRVLWLDEENIPTSSTEAANLAAGLSKIRPQQTSPDPSFATEGVLRIHLLEGQNLVPKDNMVGGMVKGKSDPYVKINIGGETFESRVINRNLNPTWNEMYEVVLTTLPGQELHVELFDKDMDMKDDFMGRLKISLKDIITSQYTDQWYTLNDVKSGRLHLVLEWVPTVSQPDRLDQVFQFQSRQSYHNKAFPSMALLFVFVERADGLPLKKSGKEPKVGAELVVGGTSHKTTVCDRTISPQWDEAFYFLVHDPREEILIVKLSHSWTLPIGSLVVPVRELLSEPDLVLDQWLSLDGASPDSQILLRAELKVLCPKKCEIDVERADQPRARAASTAEQTLERDTVQQRCISVDTPSAPSPSPSSIPAPVPEPEEAKRVTVTEMVPEEVTEEPSHPGTLPTHTNPEPSFGSEGVLRIHLLEAQNLIAKDNLMGGLKKGKSDPYVKINIGGVKFKSHVIKENLNPTWNEMYETVMTPQSDQEVQVELYDKDMDKDDFLGRCNISMRDIIHSQYTDQWYILNDVKSGRVHLVLEWVPTVSQPDRLDQVLQLQSIQSYQNKAVPSAALLFVYMDRAHSLPLKKSGKEPNAGAELVLGETTYRTKVCDRTNSPQWEEAFYFLVRDPREEILIVKLSSAWDQAMGSLVVPVRELLSEPDLVLDQWLSLDGASPDSQILLRAELKVLCPKKCEIDVERADQPRARAASTAEQTLERDTVQQRCISVDTPSAPSPSPSSIPAPVPEPEEAKRVTVTEMVPEEVTEEPSHPGTLPTHTNPEPSFGSEGVLRIHLLEAQNLIAKDNLMGGLKKGKSDPYVKINIGGVKFKSHVIKENLNPTWNEMYETVMTPQSDQEVQVELYDKDMDKDDFLGRCNISMRDIIHSQYTDQWYILNDVKSGRVHLVLEWVPTVSQPDRLDQVLQLQSIQSYQNKAVPSAALLFVYMDRAHSLPLKKSGKEPNAGAELVLGETTYRTKVCDRTNSPQWEEAFYFLVRDPREEILIVKLSSAWDQAMGSLVVPVRELLSEPDLVLDQWLSLDGASPDSQILLRAELKVLCPKKCEIDVERADQPRARAASTAEQTLERDTVQQRCISVDTPSAPSPSPSSIPAPVPEPEEAKRVTVTEMVPEEVTEEPSHPGTLPTHTNPEPSFGSEGVLRIHLLEAQNLIAKDNLMGGLKKGKSDPYVKINIGGVKFKSHVIKENLNPTWNEMYETVMTPQSDQEVQVELYDKDMDKDDFLGRCNISMRDIIHSQYTDQWYILNDVKSGRVHLVLEWVPTVSQPDRLDQVLQLQSIQSYQNKAVPSAALLFVYMDRAHSLPLKKSGKEPNAGAELVLGETTYRTKVCDRTNSPQWEEAFYFLVRDPREEILIVKLSSAWDQAMGSLVVPVRELLSEPDLVLDQWLSLDGASPDSQILLRAELKVLCPKKCEIDVERADQPRARAASTAEQTLERDTVQQRCISVDTPSAPSPSPSSIPAPVPEPEEAKRVTVTEMVPEEVTEEPSHPGTLPTHTNPEPSFGSEGVLRIHLLEAQNLIAKDNLMGGLKKGKSDPYVKINIGGVKFKSHVIKENLNPTWNEMYETVMTPQSDQEVQVELYDKDMDKDDFLGRCNISMRDIIHSQYTDQWYILNDVKSGRVHLVLEWVPTVSQPDRLDQVLQLQSIQSYQNKAVPSAALLFVYMDRAHSLPLKKSGKEPNAGAELVLGETTYRTKVCDRTNSPQWEEAFYFLVRDPREEILIVKLSSAWDQAMGSLVVPVRELLSEPDLVLDQWLSLDGASPDSQILLRAELKVLCPKKCEIDVERADQPRARAASTAEQTLERDTVQQRCISVDTPSAPSPSPSSIPAPVPEPEEAKRVTVTEMVPEEVTEEPSHPGTLPTHTNPEPSFGSEGVLRIHLLEAQNLIAKDNLMGGLKKGKSDPYVKINIGGVKFKSHVIKENLNPTWNEMYETVMTPQSDQEVQVELYDKDMDKDDFLGRCNISMRDIIHSQYTDQWYILNDVKSGRVHLVLEWVPTVSQPDRLDQVLQLQSIQSYQNKAVPSAALLFVYMDRAHSLPLKKSGKEPNAGAELVLGETTYRTKVCDRTNSPQWEEAFYFLVRDPREEILIVKLSSAWDQAMGSLVVPVRELLSEPDLVLDQWLSLDGASPDSQILLRAELKILNSKMTEGVGVPQGSVSGPEIIMSGSYSEEKEQITIEQPVTATIGEKQHSEVPSEESVAVSSQPSISETEEAEVVFEVPKEDPSPPETLPPHTTPDPSFDTEIGSSVSSGSSITQLSVTADTEELQPWQGPSAGSVTEDIARATVSSLPSVSVPEEAEVMPDVIPETRPPHTTPHPSFGTEGVLRIHVLEAQDLVAMDKLMGGLKKGKSDPYVKINIGVVKFKSRVIKENLNPTWNEMFETVLNPQAGQEVQVELYDKDMDADDFLGRFMMRLSDVISSQYTDQWYTLNDVKSGRLHLVLEWVPTVSQPDRLNKVLQLQSLQSYQNKAVPSAALLFVYMDRAHSLPLKKSGKEPKAGAELVLGETTYRTKVCDRTNSPQWEEAFYFLVRDPREEIFIVKLSSAWDQAMGSLVVPVRELLSEPDLVLDQWLSLDGASPDSQILLRAELKILNSKMTEGVGVPQGSVSGPEIIMSGSYSEEKEQITIEQPVTATIGEKQHSEVPSEESVAVSSQPSISETEEAEVVFEVPKEDPSPPETLPPHTTPDPSFDTEIEEPEETEEPITQLSVTADTEELQPWQGPTAGSVTEDIARATVSSLPSVSVPEEAEVMPDVIPETRPPHTTPHPSFGTEGVLRIHVLEAQDLVAMDKLMGGLKKGKSDPYVKINIGVVKFKSRVIKENLNPTWNEMFETVLNPQAGQEVQVELYDKDMDADDFLGRFMMRLSDVISSQYTDQWYTLNDVKSGRLHLVLEWVPTVSQPDRLDQVLQLQSLQSYQNKAVPSAALLFVYMDRAHSLPMKKSGKEPKAGAELVLVETTYRTKVCDRTNSPQWDEAFYFLVRDPKEEMLIVKLSSAWDQAMGSLVVPVRELLSQPDLVLDQWLSLDGASPDSQILLRAELKILESKMVDLIGHGILPCAAGNCGQVKLSLSYASKKKKLTITVHACRDLESPSKDGLDTYVSLMLLPDKNKATKRKTSIKKRDLNPEYNERFEFELSVEEARRRHLSVSVKNSKASFRSSDLIGQVQIELAQIDLASGVTEWFDLKQEAE